MNSRDTGSSSGGANYRPRYRGAGGRAGVRGLGADLVNLQKIVPTTKDTLFSLHIGDDLLSLVIALSPSAYVNAAVIDFDTLVGGGDGSGSVADGYAEDAFVHRNLDALGSSSAFTVWLSGSSNYTGSPAISNGPLGEVLLVKDNGGPFNLDSIDIASWRSDLGTGNSRIIVDFKVRKQTEPQPWSKSMSVLILGM